MTTQQNQNVRFVRINGRIVPIKQKGPGTPPSKGGSGAKNRSGMPPLTRLANDKERLQNRVGMGFIGGMFGGAAGAVAGGSAGLGAKFLGSKVKKLNVLKKVSASNGVLIGAAAGALAFGSLFGRENKNLQVKNQDWVKERRKRGLPAGQKAWREELNKEWRAKTNKEA